jgi:hypothetical protein
VIPVVIAPLLYGVPHFLGWSELFPTPFERQFWHISTCVVSGSLFFLVLFVLALAIHLDIVIGLVAGVILGGIAYVVASGFLLGESLRQLFFLDPAAYQLTSWSSYWPHFS